MRKLKEREIVIVRIAMNLILLAGFFLLVRLIYNAITGELVSEMQHEYRNIELTTVKALLITLPIPLHVIAIGLILQKRWFSKVWKRIAWFAIIASGMWLGIALLIRIVSN